MTETKIQYFNNLLRETESKLKELSEEVGEQLAKREKILAKLDELNEELRNGRETKRNTSYQ